MSISLFVTRGLDKGKSFTLGKNRISIGRDLSNDVTISDEEVSRRHCYLLLDQETFEVIDEGSSNGTFVNGDRIDRTIVSSTDVIRIGQTQFTIGSSADILIQTDSINEETNVVEQMALDTCVMPMPQVMDDSDDSIHEDAGRRFVRIQNDLRFVYQASLATRRQVDTLKMFEELLDLIFGWVAADRGCVFLREGNSDEYPIRLVKNRSVVSETAIEVCDAVVDYVIDQKVGVLSSSPDDSVRRIATSKTSTVQISEVICVPIQARGSGLLGVFYVDTLVNASTTRIPRFTKDHLRLMLSMANQAAMVVENETYYQSLIEKERLSAVGETVALLSHQVNNILQGINGGRHLVEMGLDQDRFDLARQGWAIVERNQKRVSKLMLDLVFLSQPYCPEISQVDLMDVVNDAISRAQSDSQKGEYKIQVTCNQDLSPIGLDQENIKLAISNLIVLCMEASRNSNEIDIRIKPGHDIEMEIIYHGVEIYSSQQISDERLQDSSSFVYGGIELAMCKKLIQGHGGDLQLIDQENGWHHVKLSLTSVPNGLA